MQMVGRRHEIGCTLSLRRAVQTQRNREGEAERERKRKEKRGNAVIKVLVLRHGVTGKKYRGLA